MLKIITYKLYCVKARKERSGDFLSRREVLSKVDVGYAVSEDVSLRRSGLAARDWTVVRAMDLPSFYSARRKATARPRMRIVVNS